MFNAHSDLHITGTRLSTLFTEFVAGDPQLADLRWAEQAAPPNRGISNTMCFNLWFEGNPSGLLVFPDARLKEKGSQFSSSPSAYAVLTLAENEETGSIMLEVMAAKSGRIDEARGDELQKKFRGFLLRKYYGVGS